MSLENDINQHVFRNDYQKAVLNLIYTFNWMNERVNKSFKPFEVTQQQYNILRILRGAGKPLSTLQIRQRMLDKMSDTSRLVDRLIKKELVKKSVSAGDRRLVDVELTDKGKSLLLEMDVLNAEFDAVLSRLSAEEARKLNELLDKVRSSDQAQ
ncbi:MAG TPA: MarR family transcriptional regulator [Puia sp.]|nr:MarR family transcriptional regulator [Puia sp.]